jgi:hypothetical protein
MNNINTRPGPDGSIANGLNEIFKPYKDFVANVPMANGNYQDLGATVSMATDVRVVGQKDSVNRRAHAWIQNRKHTWCAVVGGVTNCPYTWDSSRLSGTVTISGFASNTSYPVQWFYFDNAGILSQPSATTATSDTVGNIVLNLGGLPASAVDAAVKIGVYP